MSLSFGAGKFSTDTTFARVPAFLLNPLAMAEPENKYALHEAAQEGKSKDTSSQCILSLTASSPSGRIPFERTSLRPPSAPF